MVDSMQRYLEREMECESLLECVLGLKELDRSCFQVLAASDHPLTVDELADRIGRERSTAYRSVQRLLGAGFVEKSQENYEGGGYYHVYRPADPNEIADELQAMIDDWYDTVSQLVDEFREKYRRAHLESARAKR